MAHRTLKLVGADDDGEAGDPLALALSDTALQHHVSEPLDNSPAHDWSIERNGSSITLEASHKTLEWRLSLQLARHGTGEAGRVDVSLEASSWYNPASSISEGRLEMAHIETSVRTARLEASEHREVLEALTRVSARLRSETRKALADVAGELLDDRFAM